MEGGRPSFVLRHGRGKSEGRILFSTISGGEENRDANERAQK